MVYLTILFALVAGFCFGHLVGREYADIVRSKRSDSDEDHSKQSQSLTNDIMGLSDDDNRKLNDLKNAVIKSIKKLSAGEMMILHMSIKRLENADENGCNLQVNGSVIAPHELN